MVPRRPPVGDPEAVGERLMEGDGVDRFADLGEPSGSWWLVEGALVGDAKWDDVSPTAAFLTAANFAAGPSIRLISVTYVEPE